MCNEQPIPLTALPAYPNSQVQFTSNDDHDGDVFVGLDGEINAIESADVFAAHAVKTAEILDVD